MSKGDVEKFVQEWWSGIDLGYRFSVHQWTLLSHSDPLSFWQDLMTAFPPEPTSPTVHLQKYDFYSDSILKHLGKNICALRTIGVKGEVETWTYEQIHEMVEVQAGVWKQTYHVEPAQTVALILPQGLFFVVGLMTALRLGLVISILPLDDRFLAQKQLLKAVEALKPSLVVTKGAIGKQLSDKSAILELDLSLKRSALTLPESHPYLANDVVFKHYHPFGEGKEGIRPLEAMRSYLIPLRDAKLALNLQETMRWARPLSSLHLEEPCCTLIALLAGATIVHVPDEIILSNPAALKDESIEVLGVSPLLQQLWTQSPHCPSSKLKLWYRTPLWGSDYHWSAFNELNCLQKIPNSQLLIDKDRGGMILFSQPKSFEKTSFMRPTLGVSWNLLNLNGSGDQAVEGFGLFHIEPALENKDYFILAQLGNEWTLSSAVVPLKEGCPYPAQAVEDTVKMLDFVFASVVIPLRHPQQVLNKQFVLLVFVSPLEKNSLNQKKDNWLQSIHEHIRTFLGEAYIPDLVQFYTLYPKMEKKEIDRSWISNQYQNGSLYIKQNKSVYHHLNLLRRSIYENITYANRDI